MGRKNHHEKVSLIGAVIIIFVLLMWRAVNIIRYLAGGNCQCVSTGGSTGLLKCGGDIVASNSISVCLFSTLIIFIVFVAIVFISIKRGVFAKKVQK